MGRKFRLSQRKGYQTSKPKQQPPKKEELIKDQPPNEEELIEDALCSTIFQSVAIQTNISRFDVASVAVQTDVSCFAKTFVAIQTDMSCLDEVSPIAISSGLELLSMYIPVTSQL